jgi:cobalamin biosynthesis protein CobT
MEAQTSHEKNRLQAIKLKVSDVQEKLSTRLPAQFRHVAALVCGAKWRLKALQLSVEEASALAKKTRLELGAFDYCVKEQAELLTRHLLELDDVLSYGDEDIKRARKALVVFVQQLLPQADAFKERSAKLRQFGEKLLEGFEAATPAPATPSDSGSESDDLHVKALFEDSDEEESESEAEQEEEVAEDEEMQEMEEPVDVEEEGDEPMEDEVDEAEDEEEEEEEPPQKTSPVQALDIDFNSLPEWLPYYQLQRRQDGIYLIARLGNTEPRNVRVQWNEHSGVLHVSGFRLPTQKDLVMSRLSGAPTFGRFELAEQFPRNMLDMEEATQQIFEDGTLQIRMPYRVVRRPMRYRPTSFFQPQDCFVW